MPHNNIHKTNYHSSDPVTNESIKEAYKRLAAIEKKLQDIFNAKSDTRANRVINCRNCWICNILDRIKALWR